jgi:secretion/DNA translocation related CpaE-like protein
MKPLPAGPLILTRDAELADELQRLCAAAAVTPILVSEPEQARRPWSSSACVLMGEDCAGDLSELDLDRRDDVVLVARAPETAAVWQRAVSVRADHVAVLPDAQRWLVDWLAETRDRDSATGVSVGVMGARGGAGSSVFAASLALTAASDHQTVLIDADPLGGGLELLVGCERVPGLRWDDLRETQGRVSGAALRAALPVHEGLAVLSARGYGAPDLSQVRELLDTASRGADLVVLDLARRLDDPMVELVAALDVVIVVTTPEIRAVAGATHVIRVLDGCCSDLRLAVRTSRLSSLVVDDLVASLDVPLAAVVPTRRSLQRSLDDGHGPLLTAHERRTMRRVAKSLAATRAPALARRA